MREQRQIISLVGMTGCGKTSVGKVLAGRVGADFVDVDDEIVRKYGNIRRIFDERGDEGFREVEYETLREILDAANPKKITIVSCGGGLPTYENSARLIAERTLVVWLRRSPDSIPDDSEVLLRPPVNGSRENYKRLLDTRYPIYRRVSDYSFYNSFPKRTAREIAHRLGIAKKNNPLITNGSVMS